MGAAQGHGVALGASSEKLGVFWLTLEVQDDRQLAPKPLLSCRDHNVSSAAYCNGLLRLRSAFKDADGHTPNLQHCS